MQPDSRLERQVSAALIRLRVRSPFFATLALFTAILPTAELSSAATDGRTIWLNADYFQALSPAEQDVVLLHEVLHAALCHVGRRGVRDPGLWNIACDLVISGVLAQQAGLKLPDTLLRDAELEPWSVEEIYEFLLANPSRAPLLEEPDLLDEAPGDTWRAGYELSDPVAPPPLSPAALATYWDNARDQAKVIAQAAQGEKLPRGLLRELGMLDPARLDWRSHLWRFLVQTPSDFQGYDRRFISRGLYLDALEGETVRVSIAVDTSGSMDAPAVRMVMSEVQDILRAYPQLICELFYADTGLYGPYLLRPHDPLPPVQGGGGTDFRPFFAELERPDRRHSSAVSIYLTDGHGSFPEQAPDLPVLWAVTAGGRALEEFPFGEAMRVMPDGR